MKLGITVENEWLQEVSHFESNGIVKIDFSERRNRGNSIVDNPVV